jgi:predicted small lipoprotein YifL
MLGLAVGSSVVLLLMACALPGCGQKGPLTLPARSAATSAPTAPTAAAAASEPAAAASPVQAR